MVYRPHKPNNLAACQAECKSDPSCFGLVVTSARVSGGATACQSVRCCPKFIPDGNWNYMSKACFAPPPRPTPSPTPRPTPEPPTVIHQIKMLQKHDITFDLDAPKGRSKVRLKAEASYFSIAEISKTNLVIFKLHCTQTPGSPGKFNLLTHTGSPNKL